MSSSSLALDTAAVANAKRSLAQFKSSGHNVDQFNGDHLKIFMQLRSFAKRVTPEMLVQAISKHKKNFEVSAGARTEYFGVPKVNFPNGLPPEIKSMEVSSEDIETIFQTCDCSMDTANFYVIHRCASRQSLGFNVKIFESIARNRSSFDTSNCVMTASAGGTDADGSTASTPIAAIANAPPSGSSSTRVLRRHISEVDSVDSDPQAKRAKDLKDTMKSLKDSLVEAMDRDQWVGEHAIQTGNVKFLLAELIQVLDDMKHAAPEADKVAADKLVLQIAAWFTTQILMRPVFKILYNFQGMMNGMLANVNPETLQSTNTDISDSVKLIESLAEVDCTDLTSGDAMPNLQLAAVQCRTKFRKSIIYQSFVEAKMEFTLDRAKKASGQDRIVLMKSCRCVDGLPEGMLTTISVVNTLFNEEISFQTRLEYLANSESPSTLKLALEWDPEGAIGVAAVCLQETADITGRPYATVEQVFKGIVSSVSDPQIEIKNPLMSATRQFVGSVFGVEPLPGGPSIWQRIIVASSLQTRLDVNINDVEGLQNIANFHAETDIPSKYQTDAYKATKEYLKSVKKEDVPTWFATWSTARKEKDKKTREMKLEVCGNEQEGPAVAEAEPVAESAASASASASAEAVEATELFKVGDHVVTHAAKSKDSFDMQDGEIVGVLAKHYKVKLFTGLVKGEVKKFFFRNVTLKNPEPEPIATAAVGGNAESEQTAQASPTALAAPEVDNMRDMRDLWEQ